MRNWRIQKVWNRKESKSLWLHWWSIVDLEKLVSDIHRLIQAKKKSGDYVSEGTKLMK